MNTVILEIKDLLPENGMEKTKLNTLKFAIPGLILILVGFFLDASMARMAFVFGLLSLAYSLTRLKFIPYNSFSFNAEKAEIWANRKWMNAKVSIKDLKQIYRLENDEAVIYLTKNQSVTIIGKENNKEILTEILQRGYFPLHKTLDETDYSLRSYFMMIILALNILVVSLATDLVFTALILSSLAIWHKAYFLIFSEDF